MKLKTYWNLILIKYVRKPAFQYSLYASFNFANLIHFQIVPFNTLINIKVTMLKIRVNKSYYYYFFKFKSFPQKSIYSFGKVFVIELYHKLIGHTYSSLHWPILVLFCVFFIQWSIFPSVNFPSHARSVYKSTLLLFNISCGCSNSSANRPNDIFLRKESN